MSTRYVILHGHTRRHVARLDSISARAYDRRILCGGMQTVCVVGADTNGWDDDPFAEVIDTNRQVTCHRCAERYERAFKKGTES